MLRAWRTGPRTAFFLVAYADYQAVKHAGAACADCLAAGKRRRVEAKFGGGTPGPTPAGTQGDPQP